MITKTFAPNEEQAKLAANFDKYKPFSATMSKNNLADPFIDRGSSDTPTTETSVPKVLERFDIGLGMHQDRFFLRGFLPTAFLKYEVLMAKHMSRGKGYTTPKPDALLGARGDYYPGPPNNIKLSDRVHNLLNISPGMQHPYFLLEGKCKDGTQRVLELQGRSGSSTIVRTNRELHEYAYDTTLSEIGPDYKTFIFASTTTAQVYTIYVTFAVIDIDGVVRYHMNSIRKILIDAPDALTTGRRWNGNISDWGLLNRREGILDMRKRLFERETARHLNEIRLEEEQAREAEEVKAAAKAAAAASTPGKKRKDRP